MTGDPAPSGRARHAAWSLDPSITFLNHGSFGACPVAVLDAQRRWRDRLEAEPVRFLARELDGHLAAARATIGAFLHADPDGLAFVPNATTGINTVLGSLTIRPGDELLTTDHEYNATLNALQGLARRDGARVVIAQIPFPIRGPEEALDAVLAAVGPRTRVALISHVTSPTAIVLPIADLVRELDARGIDTIVDAAHSPGMVPIDVDGLGAAWWAGNGHKWLCGPKGSAVLWVRPDKRSAIHPLVTSHGANDARAGRGERSRFRAEFDWTGTADPTPYLALADALSIVARLEPGGWPAIMAANHDLVVAGREILVRALDVPPPAPDALLGSMAAVPLPDLTTDDDADALSEALADEDRVTVPISAWPVPAARDARPPRAVLLRISAQRYNTLADYERLASALGGRRARRSAGSTSRPHPRAAR